MRKVAVLLVAIVAFVGLGLGAIVLAKTAAEAPESVTLDCGPKQPSVSFPHQKHFKDLAIACDTCHHQNKGMKLGDKTEVKGCISCHQKPAKPEQPACTEMSATKNPFHIRCRGCHTEKGKGPTKCGDCHKK